MRTKNKVGYIYRDQNLFRVPQIREILYYEEK